jgi:hypothetical protein
MSNIVRKGDFLVFEDTDGNVTEFFVSKGSFDLDGCHVGSTGRKRVYGCFGFKIAGGLLTCGHYYEEGISYWITRKATLEERERFLRWMEEKGHKFNMNTLEITLNR